MKYKINDEVDLIELVISLWKYKLTVIVIIIFSTIISFILLKNIAHNKAKYETIIEYELNLSHLIQLNYNDYNNFSKKILTEFVNENYNENLIFINNRQIKVLTSDELKFDNILKKANNEITNIVLNKIMMEIDYYAIIYKKNGIELEKNQKYMDKLLLKEFLDSGIKIYDFETIRTTKIKFKYFKLIAYSIVLSLLNGMIFILRNLIHKKLKRISSKKK
jgi:hypothetical protein